MSAICGIVNPSGHLVLPDELAPMLNQMTHYGPDGVGTWFEASASLGYRMLWATPQSLNEAQPASAAACLGLEGRSLQITADCRLDNRSELCQSLAIPAAEWATIPDSQLILAAYVRWGEQCPEHLLGDFAFAIWDGNNHTLFCARDVMGVRAFYYTQTPARFLFASDQNALLAALDEAPAVNEPYLKAQLMDIFFSHPSQTLFAGIMKLAPAHSLTLGPKGLQLRRYWQPGQGPEIQLSSDRDYADMALDLLQQAVDCRLRSAYPVGSNLSGGMDSSAVTVLAARRLRAKGETLATYSWSPPVDEQDYLPDDERPFIEAICAQEGLTTHYAQCSVEDQLAYYKQGLQLFARFPIGPTMENAKAAHAQGVRVILSGWGGDETISFGSKGYLLELLLKGRWRTLAHELPLQAQRKGLQPAKLAYGLARGLLIPEPLRHWRQRRKRRQQALTQPYYAPDFVAAMADVTALEMAPIPDWGQSRFQRALLAYGHLTDRFVAWTAITAPYQLEWRHPMLDRRLIDFCLTIPGRLYHTNGWPRYMFNMMMEGVLPSEMVWRNNKAEPARMEQTYRTGEPALEEFMADFCRQRDVPSYPIVNRNALRVDHPPLKDISRDALEESVQQVKAVQYEQAISRSHRATLDLPDSSTIESNAMSSAPQLLSTSVAN